MIINHNGVYDENYEDYDKNHKEYDKNHVIDLSKACALEYAKEDGYNAVAEQAADVGVYCHLKKKKYYIPNI